MLLRAGRGRREVLVSYNCPPWPGLEVCVNGQLGCLSFFWANDLITVAPGLKNEPIDLTFSDSDESPKPAPPSLPNFPDVINVTSGEEQAEPRSGEEENSHVHVKEEDGGPSKRHRETDVSGSPSKPKKFRQTARKSAHHPNHGTFRCTLPV